MLALWLWLLIAVIGAFAAPHVLKYLAKRAGRAEVKHTRASRDATSGADSRWESDEAENARGTRKMIEETLDLAHVHPMGAITVYLIMGLFWPAIAAMGLAYAVLSFSPIRWLNYGYLCDGGCGREIGTWGGPGLTRWKAKKNGWVFPGKTAECYCRVCGLTGRVPAVTASADGRR
jgi:hypothetical protein